MKTIPHISKFYEAGKAGRVNAQYSSDGKLVLFNYSQETQFSRGWDAVTLQSRGIVFEISTGNVIAYPFPKFFNIEEHESHEIPNETFEVFHKVDGSLGIVYYYDGTWRVNTRGSFESDQAVEAKKMLLGLDTNLLDTNVTYLVEIIFPENRIVVDYGPMSTLILLAGYRRTDNMTFAEIPFSKLENRTPFNEVSRSFFEDYNTIKALDWDNAEGFVIRFESGFRVKIKFETYVRLHSLMTDMTPKKILRALAAGSPITSDLKDVPDELFDEIRDWENKFTQEYTMINIDVLHSCMLARSLPTRKEQAFFIKKDSKYPGSVFGLLDNKDISAGIWKIVENKLL